MSTSTAIDNLVARQPTTVVSTVPEFKKNQEEWTGLLGELSERLKEATNEGKPKHIALHRKRGQLPGMPKGKKKIKKNACINAITFFAANRDYYF